MSIPQASACYLHWRRKQSAAKMLSKITFLDGDFCEESPHHLHTEEDQSITVEGSTGFSSNFKLLPENNVRTYVHVSAGWEVPTSNPKMHVYVRKVNYAVYTTPPFQWRSCLCSIKLCLHPEVESPWCLRSRLGWEEDLFHRNRTISRRVPKMSILVIIWNEMSAK